MYKNIMKENSKKKPKLNKINVSLLMSGLLLISTHAHSILTAKTTQQIHGHAPTLAGDFPEDSFSFTIDGGTTYYSALDKNIPEKFPKDLTFGQFTTIALSQDLYFDPNGDDAVLPNPITTTPIVPHITWYDADDNQITDPALAALPRLKDQQIGCSGYKSPLKLKISIDSINIKSRFGLPNETNLPTGLSKIYDINIESGICGLRPNSIIVDPAKQWKSGKPGQDWNVDPERQKNGGGYDPAHFSPFYGFRPDSPVKYPTSGFYGAKFEMTMAGGQDMYEYQLVSGQYVSINPTTGMVFLGSGSESEPNGITGDIQGLSLPSQVTVRATNKTTREAFDYSFSLNHWYWMDKRDRSSISSLLGFCTPSFALKRISMTNSPKAASPALLLTELTNPATRSIGGIGALLGEWMPIDPTGYPESVRAMMTNVHGSSPFLSTELSSNVDTNTGTFHPFAVSPRTGSVELFAEKNSINGIALCGR